MIVVSGAVIDALTFGFLGGGGLLGSRSLALPAGARGVGERADVRLESGALTPLFFSITLAHALVLFS